MTNVNERNVNYINVTETMFDTIVDDADINLPLVKSQFLADALLWNNVTIKLMELYYNLYNSLEAISEENRHDITENIVNTLNELVLTPEYKYYESSTINIFKDIEEDIDIAQNYGIITTDEYKELKDWAYNEIKETTSVKSDIIQNFRFVNIEYSFHNHYMRLDGVHYNGLTNDVFINRILDKIYENDTSTAQIIKVQLENKGYYHRRVASILSDGTMIELYLDYENQDGCGMVRFVRSGGETNQVECYSKQEGFDASTSEEEKDKVVDRCMNELFNIMQVVEAL